VKVDEQGQSFRSLKFCGNEECADGQLLPASVRCLLLQARMGSGVLNHWRWILRGWILCVGEAGARQENKTGG